jgi:regulatory associated protein of mTOR
MVALYQDGKPVKLCQNFLVPNTIIFSVAGDIKLFDLRRHSAIASVHTTHGMTSMAVHQNAEIFCWYVINALIVIITYYLHFVQLCFSGSVNQFIGVYPLPGSPALGNVSEIGSIRYQEGFRGQRLGPASCLTFHPLRIMLAAGSVDYSVRVYGQDNARR